MLSMWLKNSVYCAFDMGESSKTARFECFCLSYSHRLIKTSVNSTNACPDSKDFRTIGVCPIVANTHRDVRSVSQVEEPCF